MVYVIDRGSEIDAPVEFVWKYLYGGMSHDKAHTTTRKPHFEEVSPVTFVYASERFLRGKWLPDRMRISMFPPVAVVTEWLEGVLEGSRFVYVYAPKGDKTAVDVYGEFSSNILTPAETEAAAQEFLSSEFEADAPIIRAEYLKQQRVGPLVKS